MNEESSYLLKVLRGFILGEDPGSFCGDWGALIRLADIHSVTGILGYMGMQYPGNGQAADFLRKQCLNTVAVFSQRGDKVKRLIRRMNAQGIDHLLFKGYVVKDYYPIPELRTFLDIDFLIRPEDRKKSDALMLAEGFARKTDWEPVYSYVRQDEYYEVHTEVMEVDVSDKADYKGYFRHIWGHARLVEEHTWEPEPAYHFLYLLTHIAKHIRGAGAGIRMYMDIAFFIRRFGSSLDWDSVRGELEALGLGDFANMVLTVIGQFLGVESPIPLKPVKAEVVEDFVEFTMSAGTFGHVGRDDGLISLKSQNRTDAESVSRLEAFRQRLFPSAASLETRYTYLRNKPWLLPAAWVHRLYRTRSTFGQHVQEARSILSTDREAVKKLKRIYKEIGL